MRVKITTIRDFPDDQYWKWVIMANHVNGNDPFRRLDGHELKEKGIFKITSEDLIGAFSTTRATTTYEIMED